MVLIGFLILMVTCFIIFAFFSAKRCVVWANKWNKAVCISSGGWTKQGHSLSNAFSSDPKWILPRGFHTSFTRLAKDSVDAEAKKATDAKKKKDAIKG